MATRGQLKSCRVESSLRAARPASFWNERSKFFSFKPPVRGHPFMSQEFIQVTINIIIIQWTSYNSNFRLTRIIFFWSIWSKFTWFTSYNSNYNATRFFWSVHLASSYAEFTVYVCDSYNSQLGLFTFDISAHDGWRLVTHVLSPTQKTDRFRHQGVLRGSFLTNPREWIVRLSWSYSSRGVTGPVG